MFWEDFVKKIAKYFELQTNFGQDIYCEISVQKEEHLNSIRYSIMETSYVKKEPVYEKPNAVTLYPLAHNSSSGDQYNLP